MPRIPAYRHHKASGRAVVTLAGKDYYLGPHGSPESRQAYDRLLAEWLTRRGEGPIRTDTPLSIAELAVRYLKHADTHYRHADGTPTSETTSIRFAMRPLNRLYSRLPAREFSPLKLRAVRDEMIRMGWTRKNINRQIHRIRLIFKWAAGHELLPIEVSQSLAAVEALRAGRSAAIESPPVKPVPVPMIEAVIERVPAPVKAMIQLQRLTGMRPAEVCGMRTTDIKTTGEVWEYRPPTHKTQHHGRDRAIFIGQQAKEILRPWLRTDLTACIFSPADEEKARAAELEKRSGELTPSRRARMDRSRRRRPRRGRPPTDRYTVNAYRRAIQRACDRAFELPAELKAAKEEVGKWMNKWAYQHEGRLPKLSELPRDIREKRDAVEAHRSKHRWHPHQLRHNAATELRARFGLEAARVVLGHGSVAMTEVYAEADQAKAQAIMAEVG